MLTVVGRIGDNLESFFGYMTTTGLLDSMDFLFHVIRYNPIGLAQDFSLFKFLSKARKPSTKVWHHVRNKQVRSRASLIFNTILSQELLQGTELSWS
jgi:hypothetical protein